MNLSLGNTSIVSLGLLKMIENGQFITVSEQAEKW